MLNNLFRKGLTFSIIFIFIGASIAPSINGNNGISRGIKSGDIILSNISSELDVPQSITSINNGSLSGYVTDTLMNPVEGARIRVSFHETFVENYSDSSGYYNVTNIPICWCLKNATASKEGYKSKWVLLSIDEKTTYNFLLTPSGKTLYVGGSGPGNYSTIQSAIGNASDGDTIFIYNGTYYENIIVDKPVDLIGEDRNTTIIDGGKIGNVVFISANKVTIKNFKIQNSGFDDMYHAGIEMRSSDNLILNNIVSNNVDGIEQYYSNNNTFVGNNISYNKGNGIISSFSKNNLFSENIFINNYFGVLLLIGCDSNIISENLICKNIGGCNLYFADYNEIISNCIYNNEVGIMFSEACDNNIVDSNIIKNNEIGHNDYFNNGRYNITNNIFTHNDIGIMSGSTGIIANNTISRNKHGIYMLGQSDYNIVFNNIISDNSEIGLYIGRVEYNRIEGNLIKYNRQYGIFINKSTDTMIISNTFLFNKKNAYFENCENTWKRNYWNRPRIFPCIILGKVDSKFKLEFDWFPARRPYDIPYGGIYKNEC